MSAALRRALRRCERRGGRLGRFLRPRGYRSGESHVREVVAFLERAAANRGRAWPPLVGRDHVGGVLGVPAVARTEAGRVTAARLPVPSTPPPTTTAGQLPAPTGPSRHADPGPPRRTAGNSGQITTFAVHPARARPALPSPQGLSTPRPAATRPPPERASEGGHRASVCVALVRLARTVPIQNSMKTLDTAFAQPVSLPPFRLTSLTKNEPGETSLAHGAAAAHDMGPRHGVRSLPSCDAFTCATPGSAPVTTRARSLRFAPAAGTATRPRPTRLWAAETVRSWLGVAPAQSARAVGRRKAAEAPRKPSIQCEPFRLAMPVPVSSAPRLSAWRGLRCGTLHRMASTHGAVADGALTTRSAPT